MNKNKIVKDFINNICKWVCYDHIGKGYDSFMDNIPTFEMAYLLRDKGIEKRIQKKLLKRLNLKSTVRYEINPIENGMIYIKLLKDEYTPL